MLTPNTIALAIEALEWRKENIPWMDMGLQDGHKIFEQDPDDIDAIDNAIAELEQSARDNTGGRTC